MKVLLDDNPIIRQAHERLMHFVQNDEAREAYEARMKFLRDQASRESAAREEGRDEGRDEGRGTALREAARAMKSEGLPFSTIARVTGLTEAEIADL